VLQDLVKGYMYALLAQKNDYEHEYRIKIAMRGLARDITPQQIQKSTDDANKIQKKIELLKKNKEH
jgi:hypothetical protein